MTAKKKILIIEDDTLILEMLKSILEELPYEIITAVDGENGLEKALTEKPDAIIVDLFMPKMSGAEAIVKIRSHEELKNTHIILTTAKGLDKDVVAALQSGANDYLKKPYKPEEIVERIEKILK